MIETFASGGVMMWPLLMIGVGVVVLSVRAGQHLFGEDPRPQVETERRLDGILFWGSMGIVLGFLGTVLGLVQMAQAIQHLAPVSSGLVWGGIGVSLVTLIFGFMIFLVASLLWFLLRQRYLGLASAHRRTSLQA